MEERKKRADLDGVYFPFVLMEMVTSYLTIFDLETGRLHRTLPIPEKVNTLMAYPFYWAEG
jgi:hypothetical protein